MRFFCGFVVIEGARDGSFVFRSDSIRLRADNRAEYNNYKRWMALLRLLGIHV